MSDIIKALVVDDSPLMRKTIAGILEKDKDICVVATASDPYEARDAIVKYKPDVMTLDIEMPKMDGISFLKKLIPQFALPVVVCSSLPINVFDALSAGAVDYVKKPHITTQEDLDAFAEEIIRRVRVASKVSVIKAGNRTYHVPERKKELLAGNLNSQKLIVIGGSTGATEALPVIVSQFDKSMPPVVAVVHMPEGFTELYAERLGANCPGVVVSEGKSGTYLEKGHVYIAPGNRQTKVFKDNVGYFLYCEGKKKVSGHCPSADVLFESASGSAAQNAIGVILTGMGSDGAAGLKMLRESGAYTVGQDEATSLVYGMPKVACEIGALCCQAALEDIAAIVISKLRE